VAVSQALIHEAGPLTTVQDLGRPGHLRVGIPASGPVDEEAFVLANRLVGNGDGAAALECTLMGPRIEFTDARTVAVTGAEMALTLNGAPVPRWESFRVKGGDIVKLGAARTGVRAYLAIGGGIDTPAALGSRATYLRGRLGGRALAKGDRLPLGPATAESVGRVRSERRPDYSTEPEVQVVLGPQDDRFTARGIATFLEGPYEMTPQSDRMGAGCAARSSSMPAVTTSSRTACRWAASRSWATASPSSCWSTGNPPAGTRRSRRSARSTSGASASSSPASACGSAGSIRRRPTASSKSGASFSTRPSRRDKETTMTLDNMIDDYKAKTGRSRELFEEALRVMPGGNSRTTTFFDPYPFYITRGEGARLWDADGVERLDFNGNYTSLILGPRQSPGRQGPSRTARRSACPSRARASTRSGSPRS
jgi:allophanate hydrolase subunit 2